MKKFIKIILIVLLLLSIVQLPVWAVEHPVATKIAEHLTLAPSKAAANTDAKLTNIQTRADQMISIRLSSLQKLLTRVSGDKKLSSDDKTNLTNDINTTITNLQTLKSKIDTDTDVTTAITDTKSIVTEFRIYLIYEPKMRLMVTIDNQTTLNQNLSTLSGQIRTLLTTMSGQGKDVTAAQKALDDMNTKIAEVTTKLTNASSLLKSITTSQTGQQQFVTVRQDLAQVRQDFAAIRSDIATIRGAIHQDITSSKLSGTPVAHPSCAFRPACLSAKFPCKIAEPSDGWCPIITPVITTTPTP